MGDVKWIRENGRCTRDLNDVRGIYWYDVTGLCGFDLG